jgi:hypothetical protein
LVAGQGEQRRRAPVGEAVEQIGVGGCSHSVSPSARSMRSPKNALSSTSPGTVCGAACPPRSASEDDSAAGKWHGEPRLTAAGSHPPRQGSLMGS